MKWINKTVEIDWLKPASYNPRKWSQEQKNNLRDSIQKFSCVDPIIANTDGTVIGGHFRLEVLKEEDHKKVEVRVPETKLDEDQEKELNIRLNKNSGEFDFGLLGSFDESLLEKVGFSTDELDLIFNNTVSCEKDEIVPKDVPSVVKLGDLWNLGNHRLLCGDVTKKECVDIVLRGEKPDCFFADPPYGIGYEYNSIKDVSGESYVKFCDEWFKNTPESCFKIITTGWAYQKFWWNKDPKSLLFWLCRNKQTGGDSFHFRRIEPIFTWGRPFKKYKFDFFDVSTERKDELRDLHSCPKPVTLLCDILECGVNYGGVVLEFFSGSGTTFVACEKTNRRCYGIEIDPRYCDVIIKRWEDFTGKKAIKE